MSLDDADRVWNRAALEAGGSAPGLGDRSLAALLLAHGMVMNGGVEHAAEVLDREELSAAAEGFRFYSFHEVADLIAEAASNGVQVPEAADSRYTAFIPNDDVLVQRFRELFRASPNAFAPL